MEETISSLESHQSDRTQLAQETRKLERLLYEVKARCHQEEIIKAQLDDQRKKLEHEISECRDMQETIFEQNLLRDKYLFHVSCVTNSVTIGN